MSPRFRFPWLGLIWLAAMLWCGVSNALAQDCRQDFTDAQDMVDAFPDDPESYEVLGEAQACLKQCVPSWKALTKAVELGASKDVMNVAENCMSRVLKETSCEQANAQAAEIVKISPKSARAHLLLAEAMKCKDNCAKRLVVLSDAVKLGASRDLLTNPDLGCIDRLLESGQCSDAVDEIEQGLTVLPKSANLYLSLGEARACSNECVSAWDAIAKAKQLGADTSSNALAQECLATLINSGDCQESQSQTKTIVTKYPQSFEAQALYAQASSCSNTCVESYIAWNKAVDLGGPAELAQKGDACIRASINIGQCQSVAEQTQTLLESYPRRSSLYSFLGESQACQQDCVGASKSYANAKKYGATEADDGTAQCFATLVSNNQCELALDQALQMTKANSKNPDAAWARAEARTCNGQYREALSDYQQYAKLGGDKLLAAKGINNCRSYLASLTIRITNSEKGRKIPVPQIQGVDPSLIKNTSKGVYEILNVDPSEIQITVNAGERYWPIERTISLTAGSQEEIELVVARAVFSDVKIGSFSNEMEFNLMDPRDGTLHSLEPQSTLKIPAGSSELEVRLKAGLDEAYLDLPVELKEGSFEVPMPWGWRVVDPYSGEVIDSGLTTAPTTSVEFETILPIAMRPAPIAEHKSQITGQPGQVLDFQMNLQGHKSYVAFEELRAFQIGGRRNKISHWSLLGGAILLEGLAVTSLSLMDYHASVARGIDDPQLGEVYDLAVSNAKRTRAASVGFMIAGGVAAGTAFKVTRPKVRGRTQREKELKEALLVAIKEPFDIEPIDQTEFQEHTSQFNRKKADKLSKLRATARDIAPEEIDDSTVENEVPSTDTEVDLSKRLEDFEEEKDDVETKPERIRHTVSNENRKHAISLAIALAPIGTENNAEMQVKWDIPGGIMPRYSMGIERKLTPKIKLIGLAQTTQSLALINGQTGTFLERHGLIGLAYSMGQLGPISFAPHASGGVVFRHVVPNSDFRNRYLGPAFNIGGQMTAPFGRLPISAVADLSVLINQNDLSPGEYSYVHTTGVQASFGLQYSR